VLAGMGFACLSIGRPPCGPSSGTARA
jgi:hypothetical protein